MPGWDNTDLRALRRIGVGLGAFQVIEVKENSVTEQAPENDMWDGEEGAAPAQGGATFSEHPDNPHEAPLSVNFKPGGTPQLTVRGRTVAEHMALLQDVQSSGLLALIASVNTAFGGQGAAPAPQAPAQAWQTPQTPPPFGPNVSAPQAPGYQGPPAPQMPQQQGWGGAPQGGFNGGGQQGQRKEYPAPQGWYRLNGARKEQVDAIASQFGIPKGNPTKGGKYNFWGLTPQGQPGKAWYCAPEVAQAFAQFNPVAA